MLDISLAFVSLILICGIIYVSYQNNLRSVNVAWSKGLTANNFNGWQAENALRDEILYRGAPDQVDSKRGGRAVWGTKMLREFGSPLIRVEIIDHFNPQTWPYTHDAFVHYYAYVSDEFAASFIELPTTSLDRSTNTLHIAGAFSGQNQIILAELVRIVKAKSVDKDYYVDLEELRSEVIKKIEANKFDPYATYSLEKTLKF